MLLAYAALQLFEGLARYDPGPTFPTQGFARRELEAIGLSFVVVFIVKTSSTENELPPGGEAAVVILIVALAHYAVTRPQKSASRYRAWPRAGIGFCLGTAVGALAMRWTALDAQDVFGLSLAGISAAMLTSGMAFRAAERLAVHQDEGDVGRALFRRVEDAERGEGDEVLFQMREHGETTHSMVRRTDEDEEVVEVPVELVPRVDEGEWVLVRRPTIVTSTRGGGDDYRGVETYRRLDARSGATTVGSLPVPPPPTAPLPRAVVETLLGLVVVGIIVGSFFLSRWVFP
jgi:hypothetical protein